MSKYRLSYKRPRFPAGIISHAVWLYVRFNLSLRSVEELLLERGVEISHETLRRWVIKFGPAFARSLRHGSAKPGDIWHLDEVRVKIRGEIYRLWRAVDPNGLVLDEILQRKRDTAAAKRLLKSLLKKVDTAPRGLVTDRLRSCGAARRKVASKLQHLSRKGLDNRSGNSHLPFQSRERMMRGYRSPGGLQRFVSIHSVTRNVFAPPPHRHSAKAIRYHRPEAFDVWRAATNIDA